MLIVLGDFNCKSNKWYWQDAPSVEGNDIDYLTCQYGLKQLINEPTHVLVNSATCIGLIFCSQPNLVSESGVLSSLHSNCHHQIIYAKFNLKIHYPPSNEREIWYYNQGDFDLINQAIDIVNWDVALATYDVNDQVSVFNEIILNVMKNFTPHEKISCDIKKLIHNTNMIYRSSMRNQYNQVLQQKLIRSKEILNEEIDLSREKYYEKMSNKLCNSKSNSKCYWSLLK